MVRPPLVDSNFGESVRILIPEGRAERPIAEGRRALQHPTRGRKSCIGCQHGGPQPGHSVAEMIHVHDLEKVVWPIGPTILIIFVSATGRWLTARQNSCNRREEVASVKAG